jgi:hypothetical protein
MSATTLVQETLSLEGADPCQILVLYEDAVTHDVAMEVCRRLLARFEAELAFAFSFCKFKDLDNLVSAIGRRKPWPARTSCYFPCRVMI